MNGFGTYHRTLYESLARTRYKKWKVAPPVKSKSDPLPVVNCRNCGAGVTVRKGRDVACAYCDSLLFIGVYK